MLFATSDAATVLTYTIAAVLGAIILGVGRSLMGLLRTRQTEKRQDDTDTRNLNEFLFGRERDSRTGTPGKEGWTTRVDRQMDALEKGQAKMGSMINEVLLELRTGGTHTFRGFTEQHARDAESEVEAQVAERQRVQKRDSEWDKRS